MIEVAVFDDHQGRRLALEMLLNLQTDMRCRGTYANCTGLKTNLLAAMPQVVLMDIDMPEVNGIEGVKILRRHFPDILIIMQTVFDDDDNIFVSILAGANGYVLKSVPPERLIEAIREVVAGGAPMTSSIARRTLELFRKEQGGARGAEHKLSQREIDVLTLLVKGYSHKMVAAELFISTFTVSNHVKNIYRKLEAHNASEVVAIALKRGIVI